MTELATALQLHNWGLDGYVTRPSLDQLMKSCTNPVEAAALWEQYCPWSDSNGGYIAWIAQLPK